MGLFDLPNPFQSEFWEGDIGPGKDPDTTTYDKAHQRNLDNFGSPTVTDRIDQYGLSYFSELTGNSYHSPDEAVADEAAYRAKTGRWAPGADIVDPTAAATGQQTPIENPNPPTPEITGEIMGEPPAPPRPPAPPLTRPGFTDAISPITSGFKGKTLTPQPLAPSIYDQTDTSGTSPAQLKENAPPPAAPAPQAPTIHRDQIDRILGGLTGYENDFYALSKDNTGLSVAEAQLDKANALAQLQATQQLRNNQAGALGAARGARNRGDRALLERQAVGEQAYLGQEAQRQDVVRQAEYEGNQAILRATEENADREFRFKALEKAADLGFNTAALEVDISKADLASATNYLNNEFQLQLQQGQLDERQYEALLQFTSTNTGQLLGFTRDMAAIQLEYDKLSVDDQNEADKLLMQKYGIDQQTFVALKQIKEAGKFQWDDFLTKVVAGGVTGGTSIIGDVITSGSKKGP